jgi:hypothetical protein
MKDETRQEPAKAADLQQEPAIPDDVVFPDGSQPGKKSAKKTAKKAAEKAAEKPDEAEKRPAAKADVETRAGKK